MFPSVILTFNFFGGGDGDDNDDDENGTDNDNDDDTTFAFEHVPPMIKLQKQSKQIGSLTSARVASRPSQKIARVARISTTFGPSESSRRVFF